MNSEILSHVNNLAVQIQFQFQWRFLRNLQFVVFDRSFLFRNISVILAFHSILSHIDLLFNQIPSLAYCWNYLKLFASSVDSEIPHYFLPFGIPALSVWLFFSVSTRNLRTTPMIRSICCVRLLPLRGMLKTCTFRCFASLPFGRECDPSRVRHTKAAQSDDVKDVPP